MSIVVHASDWSAIHCKPITQQRAKIVMIRPRWQSTIAILVRAHGECQSRCSDGASLSSALRRLSARCVSTFDSLLMSKPAVAELGINRRGCLISGQTSRCLRRDKLSLQSVKCEAIVANSLWENLFSLRLSSFRFFQQPELDRR